MRKIYLHKRFDSFDYYDKYLFDQNPYIFFDDIYIKEKK